MINLLYFSAGLIALALIVVLVLTTLKFRKNKTLEKTNWNEQSHRKITNLGSVEYLKILPLIDYYTASDDLAGEPGVAYLVSVNDKIILFDLGFNLKNEHPSPLQNNMEKLDVKASDLDYIVISHNHADHVGGIQAKKKNTFTISQEDEDLSHVKAYMPEQMQHSTAKVEVTKEPQEITEGVATTGTIDRALWLMGLTAEQALAVNIKDKGLVLIVGCGHQRVDRLIEKANEVFDIPIYGVIGGFHLPVKTSRLKFNLGKIIGTGKLPWQRINEEDVNKTISELEKTNLGVVSLSPHDSCDWSVDQFRRRFGSKYRNIVVGEEMII